MAAVTIWNDFGAPKNKVWHCFHCFPISHKVMGSDAMILVIIGFAATAAKSLQLCLALCNPRDDSPPGSPVSGTLQARILECAAISFSSAWKWKVTVKSLSRVRLSDPMDCSLPGPPSMGFSRQEYWSGVPLGKNKVSLFFSFIWWFILLVWCGEEVSS